MELFKVEEVLPHITPFLAALAGSSFIILVSNNFSNGKRVALQSALYCIAAAISAAFLFNNVEKLVVIWNVYRTLSYEIKLALAGFIIGCTYFGGALYVSGLPANDDAPANLLSTPASSDCNTSFEVPSTSSEDDLTFFKAMFVRLKNDFVSDLPTVYEMPEEAVKWIDEMIVYTVDGGKMNRGLATLDVCKTLFTAKGAKFGPKERSQAAALGWCVEFLQAFFLVADDVMDESVTRRGQPCWYRKENVKMIAINDSFILESCVYKILKKYFGNEKYYPQLVDLFLEVTRQTELGQLLDLTSQRLDKQIDLSRFTIRRYMSIVRYKTAFYSFYLPVALGMIMSGVAEKVHYDKAREILCKMGELFQIQDDVLDCFGDPEVIGKVGTDIQDNKCSWLVVQALDKADKKQKKILENNYGQHDEAKVAAVKDLYKSLKLKEFFENYEEETYQELQKLILESAVPHQVFNFLLKKIYKRQK